MRSIMVAAVAALALAGAGLGFGTAASADPADPPNCMGKDMGRWAREGNPEFGFTSGSGWGHFAAQNAQAEDPFGQENMGQAMVAHLAGEFSALDSVTCGD